MTTKERTKELIRNAWRTLKESNFRPCTGSWLTRRGDGTCETCAAGAVALSHILQRNQSARPTPLDVWRAAARIFGAAEATAIARGWDCDRRYDDSEMLEYYEAGREMRAEIESLFLARPS